MKYSNENYVPQIGVKTARRQSFAVWIISGSVIFVWVSLILLAPFAEARELTNISVPLYNFFANFCHQDAARSFHLENNPFAVCTRCFGIYFGLFAGFAAYPFFRRVENVEPARRGWLVLAMIPMALDWTLAFFGFWTNTHWTRFLSGAVLGAACAVYLIPALIELYRILIRKRSAKRMSN